MSEWKRGEREKEDAKWRQALESCSQATRAAAVSSRLLDACDDGVGTLAGDPDGKGRDSRESKGGGPTCCYMLAVEGGSFQGALLCA